MKRMTKTVLRMVWLAAAILFIAGMLNWRDLTPSVPRGTVRIVEDAEDYAYRSSVSRAVAAGELVYLSHGQSGVISACSREGTYRFSIVTTTMGNGEPELYEDEGFLHVIDKNAHVFVFREAELITDYQLPDREGGRELRERLHSLLPGKANRVTLEGNRVLDAQGELLFSVGGNAEQNERITLLLFMVFLSALAFTAVRRTRERGAVK